MVRTSVVCAGLAALVPCRSLVELCCDSDSVLGERAAAFGIESSRITVVDRFDLPRGVAKAQSLLAENGGSDACSALPCTAWCTWQYVNERKLGKAFCSRLAWRRRQSIKMIGGVDEC